MAPPVIVLASDTPDQVITIQDSPVNVQDSAMASIPNLQVMSPTRRRSLSEGPLGLVQPIVPSSESLVSGAERTGRGLVPYSGVITPFFVRHGGFDRQTDLPPFGAKLYRRSYPQFTV